MTKLKENNLKTWKAMVQHRIPVLAPMLYACTYVEDDNAGMATLYKGAPATVMLDPTTLTLSYSPKFMAGRTIEENAFTMAHESAHYLLNHIDRRFAMIKKEGKDEFDFDRWIVAEDLAVNDLIHKLTNWPVPKDAVPVIDKFSGFTTESIYHELKKLGGKNQPKCSGHCIHPGAKPGEGSASSELLKSQVQEAASLEVNNMVKEGKLDPGNMPGELIELSAMFKPLNRPPNWKEMLKRYLTETNIDCKYFDPSMIYRRRLAVDNLCLPNLASQPAVKKFIVSIDNSGSVSDEMFSCLCGVLDSAATTLGFQEIIIQHFTTQVMFTERVIHMTGIEKIKRRAAGGTALGDCDRLAKTHRGQFHVIMTDGYVEWLDKYSIPTIIVRTVATTTEPPKVHNLIGSVVADASKDFG